MKWTDIKRRLSMLLHSKPVVGRSPLQLVIRGMIVLLTSIGATLFIPGLIAARDKVFYDADVRNKLQPCLVSTQPPCADLMLKRYEDQKKKLDESVDSQRKQLDSLTRPDQQKEFDFYTHLLEAKQKQAASLLPPVFTIGFFLSPQMLLWPAIYASLGCLLVCFAGAGRRTSRWRRFRLIPLGLFIYVYYEWPLWVRNFLLGSHGRTVYAYTNIDIDRRSFFAQELTIAGFAFLIAAVWLRWSEISAEQENRHETRLDGSYLSPEFVLHLQQGFYRWIISSLILGLGFVYFTTFFWSLVASYHDQRYIVSAFLAHSLWALTWMFLSLPLVKSWNTLRTRRLKAIDQLIRESQSIPGKSEQLNIEGIEKLESLAGIRISIAGASAVVSLVLPLIQLFFPKK